MKKIFIVTALFISSQTFAQKDTASLENVTLTASKFSTKTTETGKVVTIISHQQIEKAGSRDLAQVITELGGVFINGYNSNIGKEKNIYLRGAKVDYTLITIDGIPVYDASGIGSNFDIRNISIDNVERIEILKGSQSTLYGSDAIAGVINIITKKGGTKPFAISGVADYGSYHTFRGDVNVSGQQKILDYNLGLSHLNTNGFSEARPQPGSNAIFDKDGYRQTSVQTNLGLQASAKIRLQPYFRFTRFKGDLDLDAFQDDKDFTNKNHNLQTGIRNTIGFGKAQVNLLYQYIHTRRNYLNDSVFHNSTEYYFFNQQQYTANEHFAEGFVVYSFSAIKLTAGADARFSNTSYNAIQKNVYSPLIDRSSFSGDSVKQNQVGVYAALNYALKNFSIEAGGRFNHHSAYGNNFAFNINPSYFIEKKVKVFANVSSGYKTPSLYQLFSIYGNKNLKPEISVNYEAGVQVFSKNEKSSLRATYFNRRINDVIAFFYNPATFQSSYINQDKQHDEGLDIDGQYNLNDKLQLRATYSYANGKITTKQNGKDTTYFNLLRRPKSMLNFSAGRQLTKALYINAQATAVGERKDVYFNPVTFKSENVTLDKYVLINFYAEYAVLNNHLKLFADLRNITDKDYSDIYGYNTARFNAYGGIRFRF